MKRIFFLIYFFSASAFAGAYENLLDCDFNALSEVNQKDNYCKSMPEGSQKYSCKADVMRKLSYTACNPVLQTSARTFVFLYEELKTVHEMYASKKISLAQANEKAQKISSLIDDESAYMLAATRNYSNALKEQEANARSRAVINNAISVLGGYSQSNNGNSIRNNNYLINGQMINCSRNGNLTTCN